MSIVLEVDGSEYDRFTEVSVEDRLDALTNTFSFTATSKEGNPLPFRGGEACEIYVDGGKVLTGNIEVVEVSYTESDHTITIQGRGKTGDLLDSTLDAISDIRPPISLKALIERIIQELDLDIKVISEVVLEDFNETEDLAGPDPGEQAWSFLEKYTRKRQVLLRENADGDIVILQASGTRVNSPLLNQLNSDTNNILSGSVSYDNTGRYNLYKFASSQNPIALVNAGGTDLSSLVNQGGGIQDPLVRLGRQLILVAESSYSNKQCELRAQWEANVRKTRSRVYAVTVDGFRNAVGDLWKNNIIVPVDDVFAGIQDDMLISSILYSFNNNEGSLTTLSLVEKESYTLSLSQGNTGLGLSI